MSMNAINQSNYYNYESRKSRYTKKDKEMFDVPASKEDIPESKKKSDYTNMTAGEFFKHEIRIDNASLKKWDEIRLNKQQDTLNDIASLYQRIGMEEKAPERYEDITETDCALYRLSKQINESGGYLTLVAMYPNTMYNHRTGQPIGFSHMDWNALSMAAMKEKFEDLYSNEGINRTIGSLNLPDTVDKEVLYKAMKTIGTEQNLLLSQNIDQAIETIASLDAKKVLGVVMPDYQSNPNGEQYVEALKNSFTEMIRESMLFAVNIIRQGTSGNYMEQISKYTYENSSVRFEIGDLRFSRKEFEETYKQILLGNGRNI